MNRRLNTLTLALIPVAIAINIAIGQLVYGVLKIPFLYLDSIGTVLVGALAGPVAGLITGALSNLIWGLSGLNPTYTPFFYVAAVIGLLAGIFARAGWMKPSNTVPEETRGIVIGPKAVLVAFLRLVLRIWRWALAGLITGVAAAILSAPTSAVVYGGVTGAGTDLIVAALRASGANIIQATFGQGIVSDPFDKLVSFLVVYVIVMALPLRTRLRFANAPHLPR